MVPHTTSRWMSITLNCDSSVVETNTLVSFTVHCRVHLGHTCHTYTQTLHSAMSRQPSFLPVATCVVVDVPIRRTHARTPARIRRCCRPPVTLRTVVRLLAYAVVVDRPFSLYTRSYACSHTPSSLTARFVAHTVVRLLAYAVVVK